MHLPEPGYYLYQYTKLNSFTACALGILGFLAFLKFFNKLPEIKVSKKTLLIIVLIGLTLRVLWVGYSTYEPKAEWIP